MPYANMPPSPPVEPVGEYLQSTVSEISEPNILSARRTKDGGWDVLVFTKNGVINRLHVPPRDPRN